MRKYDSGLNGEAVAEQYFLRSGMQLLERRYRGADGEIDLIMQDGETIVFAEVKARPCKRQGDGLIAVTPSKQKRMTHAALVYLAEHDCLDSPVRFDAIEITRDGILHIPNAFFAAQ